MQSEKEVLETILLKKSIQNLEKSINQNEIIHSALLKQENLNSNETPRRYDYILKISQLHNSITIQEQDYLKVCINKV